jgi:hypothetical protein
MLSMKNYPFQLSGKLSDFSEVLRRLNTTQDDQRSVIGRVNGNRHSLNHPALLSNSIVFRFFGFCPSCSNGFSCTLAALFPCETSGPRWTAFFAALSPKSDGRGIFPSFCYSHNHIIRERLGIAKG